MFDLVAGEDSYGSVTSPVGTEVRLLFEGAENVVEVDPLHIFNKKLASSCGLLKGHVCCRVIMNHKANDDGQITKDHGIFYA